MKKKSFIFETLIDRISVLISFILKYKVQTCRWFFYNVVNSFLKYIPKFVSDSTNPNFLRTLLLILK